MKSKHTYGHQLDVFPVQELQSHGNVLQLHLSERGALVVLAEHLLLAEHLQKRDQPEPIAQVRLQVRYALIDTFQMLVGPTRECILLDLLPWRVLGEIFLCSGHVCVLVRGERCVGLGSGGARLVGACVLTHFYRLGSPALIRCLAFWVES